MVARQAPNAFGGAQGVRTPNSDALAPKEHRRLELFFASRLHTARPVNRREPVSSAAHASRGRPLDAPGLARFLLALAEFGPMAAGNANAASRLAFMT